MRESEFATDILFATKTDLSARYPRRLQHAIEQFTTGDLLRFLGRLVPGRFKARRIARWCIGPKGSAFAIGSMKTRSRGTTQASDSSAWRYLDALSVVGDPPPSHRLLDSVSQRVTRQGRPYRPWRPMSPKEAPLFRTILQGDFTIRGFHNRDLRRYLYPAVDADPEQRRRVSARVTRSLRLLRAHGRITKVTRTRYYRITNKGHHVMTTALRFRETALALLAA